MRLRNMLKICLVVWKSEPQYAYKGYAYKKHVFIHSIELYVNNINQFKRGSLSLAQDSYAIVLSKMKSSNCSIQVTCRFSNLC